MALTFHQWSFLRERILNDSRKYSLPAAGFSVISIRLKSLGIIYLFHRATGGNYYLPAMPGIPGILKTIVPLEGSELSVQLRGYFLHQFPRDATNFGL